MCCPVPVQWLRCAVLLPLLGAAMLFPGRALAAPVLNSVTPAACMTNQSTTQQITLHGSKLSGPSTNGYTFDHDVQLYISVNGGAFQQVAGNWSAGFLLTGWDSTDLNVSLNGVITCTSPGTLRFYVRVLGVNSSVFSMPIIAPPSGPPTISSINPTSLPIAATSWGMRIVATGLDISSTGVTVNGVSPGFLSRLDAFSGYVDIVVPPSLRAQPGRYQVVVTTARGSSNPVNFDIIGPPVIKSISPSTISLLPPPRASTLARPLSPGSGPAGPVAPAGPAAPAPAPSATSHIAALQSSSVLASAIFGIPFTINASDIDANVTLTFGGQSLPIDQKVLTYGAQKIVARLPKWAQLCGTQNYAIQLRTAIGTSNTAMLVVQNTPCTNPQMALPARSIHTPPP
jgi:hypothetical protein